jgi:hypothetical protein
MPNDRFAEMDARAARVLGRNLEEPCNWVPIAKRSQIGDVYTTDQAPPLDPTRPRRDGLTAIVTFAPSVGTAGGGGEAKSATGQLVVDIEAGVFEPGKAPIKGDRFELPKQEPGMQLVEVGRISDDASARLFFYCKVV